jgi:hypothetical protein
MKKGGSKMAKKLTGETVLGDRVQGHGKTGLKVPKQPERWTSKNTASVHKANRDARKKFERTVKAGK